MRVDDTAPALPQAVATQVRDEMRRQRISQAALAERLGWPQQRVSRRITGAVAFDLAELEVIAEILAVPVAQLLPAEVTA